MVASDSHFKVGEPASIVIPVVAGQIVGLEVVVDLLVLMAISLEVGDFFNQIEGKGISR